MMNNLLFVILLFAFLALILFWANVKSYLLEMVKICHNHSGASCACAKAVSVKNEPLDSPPNKCFRELFGSEKAHADNNQQCLDTVGHVSASTRCDVSLLEKVGYFLASNDEKNVPIYRPTSLQDTDPKDLA